MKLGYLDALRVIKNLDGDDYYFYHKKDKYYNRITRNISLELMNKLKTKYKVKTSKEVVIKVVEQLLKKENRNNLMLLNIKKEIRYIKKNIIIKDNNLKEFIFSCKLL